MADKKPTTPRVRVVSVLVQPELVLDDGDLLTPIQTEPVRVAAGVWPPDLNAIVASVAEQLNL